MKSLIGFVKKKVSQVTRPFLTLHNKQLGRNEELNSLGECEMYVLEGSVPKMFQGEAVNKLPTM